MSTNRKKHTNVVQVGALARWLVMAIFLAATGLSYVYLKNQLHATGGEVKRLERDLAELTTRNEVARAQIASLSSRTVLQRRLNEGFIKMIPITDDRIVRVSGASYRVASDQIQATVASGLLK